MRAEIARVDGGGTIGHAERSELNDRATGLDLLGKPREQDLQFAGLKELEFGSEAFRQTLLGQATVEAVGELVAQGGCCFRAEGLVFEGDAPEVIAVYSEDIYANIGSEHGVRPRLRFFVYPSNERIKAEGLAPEESVALRRDRRNHQHPARQLADTPRNRGDQAGRPARISRRRIAMQGVVKYQRGDGFVELRDLADAPPGPNQVKVEVQATGVCGSDLHVYRDTINYNIQTPVVMGHEFSGVVVEKGKEVGDHVQVGATA